MRRGGSFLRIRQFVVNSMIALGTLSLPILSQAKINYLPETIVRDGAIFKELIEWEPLAQPAFHKKGPLNECQPERVLERIRSSNDSAPQATKDAIESCLPKWSMDHSMLGDLVRFSAVDYKFEQNRAFQAIKIRMPTGKIIRAVLGMKPGTQPRPIVIAACGVLCDSGDRTAAYLLMKLFDETPFHVLVLGNHTSKVFIDDNQIGGLGGGINAGESLVKIARDLRDTSNSLSSRISHVFLYGISLGGHEVLYASYLHDRMTQMGGAPVIDGLVLNSPVVDYPATIQRLTSRPVVKQIFNTALGSIFDLVSALVGFDIKAAKLKADESDADEFQVNADLFFANQAAYQKKFPREEAWELPEFQDASTLLETARFQNLASQTSLPAFAIASSNDPVVRPRSNSALLEPAGTRGNYATVIADDGAHMATALAYGWRNIHLAIQAYLLKLAPDFDSRLRTYQIQVPDLSNWKPAKTIQAKKKAKIVSVRWQPRLNSRSVDLEVTVANFSPTEPPNCKNGIDENPLACTSTFGIPMSLDDFPTALPTPVTDGELDALTRWMNVQVEIQDEDGKNPADTQKFPARALYREL